MRAGVRANFNLCNAEAAKDYKDDRHQEYLRLKLAGLDAAPVQLAVFTLTDPVEGRPEGGWVIQYHGEDFLTDPGGGNPEPFAWSDQAHQPIDFPVRTREEIAGKLRLNPAKLALVQRSDPAFPTPIVTFRDGPV